MINVAFPGFLAPQNLSKSAVDGPGLGLGGEVKSQERHGCDDDVEKTYDRHERMTSGGIGLVHLSVRRIRVSVREAAGHLLRQARSRALLPHPEPQGLTIIPRGPLLR